jgi:hypothetical protein
LSIKRDQRERRQERERRQVICPEVVKRKPPPSVGQIDENLVRGEGGENVHGTTRLSVPKLISPVFAIAFAAFFHITIFHLHDPLSLTRPGISVLFFVRVRR